MHNVEMPSGKTGLWQLPIVSTVFKGGLKGSIECQEMKNDWNEKNEIMSARKRVNLEYKCMSNDKIFAKIGREIKPISNK